MAHLDLKHKIVDAYRCADRTPRAEEPTTTGPSVERFFDRRGHWRAAPIPWDEDPGATLERDEFWDVLGGCLARLPEHLADAFLAIEVSELGRDHVCERFRITPANLATRLYRARPLLRHCLEHHYLNYELREGGRLAMWHGITIEDRSLFLKLRRQGQEFSAWSSRDGRRWVPLPRVDTTLNERVEVGVVAVNSSGRALSAELERFRVDEPQGSMARDY